jgi:hypothetical protein
MSSNPGLAGIAAKYLLAREGIRKTIPLQTNARTRAAAVQDGQYGRFATRIMAKTLYDKLWDDHTVHVEEDGTTLLYIDRHLLHEVTSPQAFEGLKLAERPVWRISANLAVSDHNVPTTDRSQGIADPISKLQVDTLDPTATPMASPSSR